MSQSSEAQFLDFLKLSDSKSEKEIYDEHDDPVDTSEGKAEFSDSVQSIAKTVDGVPARILKNQQDADRALIGALVTRRDYESSNLQLRGSDKVAHVRTPTLMEQTVNKLGRL